MVQTEPWFFGFRIDTETLFWVRNELFLPQFNEACLVQTNDAAQNNIIWISIENEFDTTRYPKLNESVRGLFLGKA